MPRPTSAPLALDSVAKAKADFETGRLVSAETHLRNVLRTERGNRAAASLLVTVLMQSGLTQSALAQVATMQDRWPEEPSMHVRRATVLHAMGRLKDAEALLQPLVEEAGLRARIGLARIALARHQPVQARNLLRGSRQVDALDLLLQAEAASGQPCTLTQLRDILAEVERPLDRARLCLVAAQPSMALDAIRKVDPCFASQSLEARARLTQGNFAEAVASYRAIWRQFGQRPAVLRSLLQALAAHRCHSPAAGAEIAELRTQITETADARARPRLLAEIAERIGDWDALSQHAADWHRDAPCDVVAVQARARAAAGQGHWAHALELLQTAIAQASDTAPVQRLAQTIAQATGRLETSFALFRDCCATKDFRQVDSTLDAMRTAFVLDDLAAGQAWLDCAILHCGSRYHGGVHTAWQLSEKHGPAPPTPNTAVPSRSGFILSDLYSSDPNGPLLFPRPEATAAIAWRHSRHKHMGYGAWLSQALRAGRATQLLIETPQPPDYWRDVCDVDLSPLLHLIARGQPALLATSHSGPPAIGILCAHIDQIFGIRNVSEGSAAHRGTWSLINFDGDVACAATKIVANLRNGASFLSVPDIPVQLARRGYRSGVARGQLFGTPIDLVDTIPKLSQALVIPSFWIQPIWQEGRIIVTAESLPEPEPDEDSQDWANRWAGAYLEKLEDLLSGHPLNLNLHAPIWKHLLHRSSPRPCSLDLYPPSLYSEMRNT